MRWMCCICFSDTRHHLLGNGTIQCARTAEAIYTCSSRESLHRNRLGLFSSWCATHRTITTAVDQPDVSSPIPSISHFLQVPLSPQSPDSPPASGSKWLVMSVQLLILRLASCSCRCLFDPAFRRFAISLYTPDCLYCSRRSWQFSESNEPCCEWQSNVTGGDARLLGCASIRFACQAP